MKTTIHRILVVLSVVILTALGASAYDFKVNGIYYNIVSDGVEVTYGSQKYFDDIKIPAKVTHNSVEYNVVGVGTEAFYNCQITSVSLPEGLKEIGSDAFSATKIRKITFPSTLKIISSRAFYGTFITDLLVPSEVEYIYEAAFAYCPQLTNVVLDCKTAGWGVMFARNDKLESVKITGNILALHAGFLAGVKIRELYIGEKVKYFSNLTFLNTSIQDIYFMSPNPPKYNHDELRDLFATGYLYDIGPSSPYPSTIIDCVNVHVPKGSTEAYRSSKLMNYLPANVNFIEDAASIDGTVAENNTEITVADGRIKADGVVEVYATDGRLVGRGLSDDLPTLTPGLYIVRTPSAAKKIMVR